ncbi:MAG TPA: 50S ribosomal protein L1 [bacterium]|nr:50S ribosomal protein L1 [bacterium]
MATSKKLAEAYSKFDKNKAYSLEEAIKILKDANYVKFDQSVEIHMNLGIDSRKSDQLVRGTVVLPNGTGKKVRVAVFAEGEAAQDAKNAGAEAVGSDDLINEIMKNGDAPYEAAIATPDMMKKLGPIARILGTKGIMPNPKKDTVTTNVVKALEDIRKGKIDFRNDDTANIHQAVGKLSFDNEKLVENAKAFIDAIQKAKPSGSKGTFIKNAVITSSMGPGVKISV